MKPLAELLPSHAAPVLVALAATVSILSGCGDAGGVAMTWEDTNCNGVKDPDEARLAGVCVWTSLDASEPTPSPEDCASEHLQTNFSGIGGGNFFPGASCNDVFVFAQAPDGFDPTTDTVVNGCSGEFGFAPAGICPPHAVATPEESNSREESRDLVPLCSWWVTVLAAAAMVGGLLLVVLLRRRREGPP